MGVYSYLDHKLLWIWNYYFSFPDQEENHSENRKHYYYDYIVNQN